MAESQILEANGKILPLPLPAAPSGSNGESSRRSTILPQSS